MKINRAGCGARVVIKGHGRHAIICMVLRTMRITMQIMRKGDRMKRRIRERGEGKREILLYMCVKERAKDKQT